MDGSRHSGKQWMHRVVTSVILCRIMGADGLTGSCLAAPANGPLSLQGAGKFFETNVFWQAAGWTAVSCLLMAVYGWQWRRHALGVASRQRLLDSMNRMGIRRLVVTPDGQLEGRAGINIHELIPALALETWERLHTEILATGSLIRNDWARLDGDALKSWEIRWVTLPESSSGNVLGWALDVHERRERENELQVRLERFEALIETNKDWLWEVNAEGQYVYSSPQIHNLLGYKEGEILGKKPFDFMPPDEAERIGTVFLALLQSGQSFHGLDNVNLHKEGHEVVLESSGSPIRDRQGKVTGYRGIDRDVTDRREAERALLESEEKYRALTEEVMDDMAVAIFILDSEHRIVWVSRAVEDYFGVAPEVLIGSDREASFRKYVVPMIEDTGPFLERILDTDRDWVNFECHILPHTLQERWLEFHGRSIRHGHYAGGRIEHFYDVTERKRADQKNREALRDKEILIREIHHRVKNNLQVITSLLNLQARKIRSKPALAAFHESQNRIKAMAMIHENLYQSDNLAQLNFPTYVKQLVDDLCRFYSLKSRRVHLTIQAENVRLSLDQAIPVGLIISELVSNSLKYAFPGEQAGGIEIFIRSQDAQTIELRIGDDGIGLAADVDPATHTQTLGLQLVYGLVRNQLGGELEWDRRKGTQYRIRFQQTHSSGTTK